MAVYEVRLNRDMYHAHIDLYDWCSQKFGPCYNMYINVRENCNWEFQTMFGASYFMFYNEEYALSFISHLKNEYNYIKYEYKHFENNND